MVAESYLDDQMNLNEALVEALAAYEHERWAHWQAYVHERCRENEDGSLTIPAELVERWTQQIDTPYENLTETEKDSDREQVRRYLPLIRKTLKGPPDNRQP